MARPFPSLRSRVHRLALRVFGRLPVRVRRVVVRAASPSYTVGAMCIIERDDGAMLFVRQSYRRRWGVPGGLLQRGEGPSDGARREVLEEVGLEIDLLGEPAVVVAPDPQRVDIVFRARATGPVDDEIVPRSPEIVAARWFAPDDLPELQAETVTALVALARATTPGSTPPLTRPRRWGVA